MKRNLQIILTATTASFLTFGVMAAQENTTPTANRTIDARERMDQPQTDGTMYGRDRVNQPQTDRLHRAAKASDIIGMTVNSHQDDKIGSVKDLAVDLESGRIVAVVVSSGGFLGMGDELSAVPPTALSFNAGRDTLLLDTTKDMMSAAPHFKSDQWPDFSQPMYSDSVYRAYKQEPYFTTNVVTAADNSARNVRDRDDATLTPFDQGNSKADTDTTAQIRKEVNASENMSVSGKNVKIITKDGRVTLRGPVDSAAEKRTIGEIAKRIARSGNVDNQLEVKSTTASMN